MPPEPPLVPQPESPPADRPTVNRFLVHQPLKYGKKFYLMEFLAERFVQAVAFISIAAILGIFYYVFQEATWTFRGANPPAATAVSAPESAASTADTGVATAGSGSGSTDAGLQPERYDADLKPEPYGQSATAAGKSGGEDSDLKPETYSSDTGLKPETYSPDASLSPEPYNPDESAPATKPAGRDIARKGSADTSTASGTPVVPASPPAAEGAAGGERSVGLAQLLQPNDTIDGTPRYIWQPVGDVPKFSFVPLFAGALKVTLIGLLLAAPIAILAALFTTAFAPRWAREILKPAIEILAGFPSVVIGFFCLMTLASVTQGVTGSTYRLNAFVGGVGMALAVIPIIYTVTEDALAAVPKFMKEASLALGASRWQTAYRVVLPAAVPGVFAAIILGFGRAFGETMIALMATGNAALTSASIFESVRTMAATIGAEMAEVEFHSVHYGLLFLIGAMLFIVTFSMNAVAEFYIRKRLMKKFQGA